MWKTRLIDLDDFFLYRGTGMTTIVYLLFAPSVCPEEYR
jgi:hypothetical protein